MSNGALRRTVRRTGAAVVFAVALATSTLIRYVQWNGLDVELQLLGSTALLLGSLGYLVVSLLVGAAASVEGQRTADSADGRE